MIYDIKRNNSIIASVRPTGKENIQMMGAENVSMSFTLTEKITFEINDWTIVYDRIYYLATEPSIEKKSSREYVYNLQFVGIKYRLGDTYYFNYDKNNELTIPEFSIITDAESLVNLLVSNANRFQTGWSKGVVDATESKQVDFSEDTCLTALNKIAEAFTLEFWVDGNKSIHFTKRNEASRYTFRYGAGNGLKGINRSPLSDSYVITRLYALGSEKNIPNNYRNGQKRLRMPVPYLDKNVSIYGIKEHIEKFEDIYPKRVGTVTSVDASNPLVFSDSTIDFDLNETDVNGNTTVLIKGLSAKVIFQTGQLAGYTFEIKQYGYNTVSKTFTLLTNQEEKATELPNNLMRPQIGDKYILVDIQMPSNYVADAEAELQTKAQEYLDKNSVQRLQYTMISDPIYFKENNIDIQVGFTNRMIDEDFGLDDHLRVTATVKDLQDQYDVQFDQSETSSLPGIVQTAIENQNQLSQIIKNTKFNTELARMSYFFSREMFDKVFDGEGYFDPENIKPLSIETKMISLGSPMQAFQIPNVSFFVENNLTSVSHTSGELVHFGFQQNATRNWFITANIITGISTKLNYIYLKAQKNGTVATVVISEQQILVESDINFYYFEAGIISSVVDGYRQIRMTHGYGMINPAEISIGKISSPFGGSYMDIQQDKIKIHADVELTDDSIAFEQINGQIFIGGENLLVRSGELLDYYGLIENKDRYFNQELPYTFSVDALNTEQTLATLAFVGKKTSNNEYVIIASKEINLKGITERVYMSFKCFLNSYKRVFGVLIKNSDSSNISIIKPKLEIGNRPTDYNQSQYDVNLKIADIEQKTNFLKTSIYGNIIATGTVLLGNYETGTNAGITGEGTVNDIFLWGGSTFTNRNTAPIRFYRNGKFYAGNAEIEGDIKAHSGFFGSGTKGFQIYESGIRTSEGMIEIQKSEPNSKSCLIQIGQNLYSYRMYIYDDRPNNAPKYGLFLNVEGGTKNTALEIYNGDIVVNNKVGINGSFQVGNLRLTFEKGIIVKNELV